MILTQKNSVDTFDDTGPLTVPQVVLFCLAISSVLPLIVPSMITYMFTELMLLIWFVIIHKRLQSIPAFNGIGFVIITVGFLFSIIVAQTIPSVDSLLKTINAAFIILLARPADLALFLRYLRPVAMFSLFVTVVIYLIQVPLPVGRIYDHIALFGRNVNTGIIFELNYAAMFALVFLISYKVSIKTTLFAVALSMFYTFRFGLSFAILILIRQLIPFTNKGIVWVIGGGLFLYLLYFLFSLGPFPLEQRYFIWDSFFSFYDPYKIYQPDDLARDIYTGMSESFWGQMENLHSGVFDTFAFNGFSSGMALLLVVFLAIYKCPPKFRHLLFFMFTLSFFMSLSLGGLNALSLAYTFMVASAFSKPEITPSET